MFARYCGLEAAAQSLGALKAAVPNLEELIWHSCYAYSVGIGFPPIWDEGGGFIQEGSEDVLEAGMTFHVSTSLRDVGRFGTAFSETVAVTADGAEVLTDVPRELVVR